jgi:hypothetical protein
MNPEDYLITVNSIDTTDSYYSYGSNNYSIDVGDLIDHSSNTITLDDIIDSPLKVAQDVHIEMDNGEHLKVKETMIQQRYEIEALTDVIKEMVVTKNFDVDFDLNKRVEQKKFLNKLGEDPNGL